MAAAKREDKAHANNFRIFSNHSARIFFKAKQTFLCYNSRSLVAAFGNLATKRKYMAEPGSLEFK